MQARWTSTVIDFPQDRVRRPTGEPQRAAGEVLIFTGVRVERMYDLAERLPPARSGYVSNARMDIDFW
ncbi:hypothetical protein DK847_04845 [Aestuariivirga litoralis]|uniref:Uncharacterized protein n=1 Tax=Aestuariivirga litoralis TaxID=2650924 RepID=A0A2W2AQU3_9HYPH|nr:hypothetical protein [Aestuariivirga litoralis]PZF77761.1 hypothetical protein DK847_04845 [Aestuariivirga litoralis]